MNSTMENVIKGILERSVAGVFSYAKVRKVESRFSLPFERGEISRLACKTNEIRNRKNVLWF